MNRFAGKVAIVTGSGQGIGRGIAKRLAGEGAALVIAELNRETAAAVQAEITSDGGRAMPYSLNVSDAAAVQEMVDCAVAEFGRIDILVNNAGVVQTKPMMQLSEADWDRVIDTNQRGAFFCLKAVAGQMIAQLPDTIRQAAEKPADIIGIKPDETASAERADSRTCYGKIVNISSISGRRGRPLATHYAASKAAIISITQSAALALAPYKINVNAVCPGVVPTPIWQQIDKDRGDLFDSQPGEAINAFVGTLPLKRAATEEDIAGAVAFFCSADANYITGQSLNVDGGFEMD